MDMHDDFYTMVKDWTSRDYCTPGIKAEVILDMLISDFIEELIQCHYRKTLGKAVDTVTLLMKEFPIKTNEKNKRNAKVDYLVRVDDTELILVELKTTRNSYKSKQEKMMLKAAKDGAGDLFAFYGQVVKASKSKNKYEYACEEYDFTRNKDKMQLGDRPDVALKYMYIFLAEQNEKEKAKENDCKETTMILMDYCENGNRYSDFIKLLMNEDEKRIQLWNMVSGILLNCSEKL